MSRQVRVKYERAIYLKKRLTHLSRTETILSVKWIAQRLSLGTPKSARARLQKWKQPRIKSVNHVAIL